MRINIRKAKVVGSRRSVAGAVLFSLFTVHCSLIAVRAQTTEFTYQGRLLESNLPPTANYDFQFSLWDAPANGTQVGATQIMGDVAVTNGIFTVRLDFGSTAFTDGGARFLQIEVRSGASTGAYTTLAPRQTFTSVPHAIKALKSNDADNLGGVAASEYVTTASVGNSFIRNNTASQTADFNVTGTGAVGTTFTVGTTSPAAGFSFHSVGSGKFQTANGDINIGSPNAETGMSMLPNSGGRADFRFNGSVITIAAGTGATTPGNTGITVNTAGNVGIGGGANLTGKLQVFGASGQPGVFAQTNNRALWGQTTGGGYGVYGESTNGTGIGVQGVSSVNIGTVGQSNSSFGVFGNSVSSSGVRGDTAGTNVSVAGVHGVSTGPGGVGVRGDGTTGVYGTSSTGTGVAGESSSTTGYGVYASNPNGPALGVIGNVIQPAQYGGIAKAMLFVNPFNLPANYIVRCYNGVTGQSSGGCGFSITRMGAGDYVVNPPPGFPLAERFYALSVTDRSSSGGPQGLHGSVRVNSGNLQLSIVGLDAVYDDTVFWLIIY